MPDRLARVHVQVHHRGDGPLRDVRVRVLAVPACLRHPTCPPATGSWAASHRPGHHGGRSARQPPSATCTRAGPRSPASTGGSPGTCRRTSASSRWRPPADPRTRGRDPVPDPQVRGDRRPGRSGGAGGWGKASPWWGGGGNGCSCSTCSGPPGGGRSRWRPRGGWGSWSRGWSCRGGWGGWPGRRGWWRSGSGRSGGRSWWTWSGRTRGWPSGSTWGPRSPSRRVGGRRARPVAPGDGAVAGPARPAAVAAARTAGRGCLLLLDVDGGVLGGHGAHQVSQ